MFEEEIRAEGLKIRREKRHMTYALKGETHVTKVFLEREDTKGLLDDEKNQEKLMYNDYKGIYTFVYRRNKKDETIKHSTTIRKER